MQNKLELLPCPFCLGDASISEAWANNGTVEEKYIECIECGASSMPTVLLSTTVTAWNRREPKQTPSTEA